VTDEVERLREQQRAVSEVLRVVARSEGLQSVLDEIVTAATRLCAGANGRVWLVRDGLLQVLAGSGDAVGYEHDREHPTPSTARRWPDAPLFRVHPCTTRHRRR